MDKDRLPEPGITQGSPPAFVAAVNLGGPAESRL
jgi:hypothetical protein